MQKTCENAACQNYEKIDRQRDSCVKNERHPDFVAYQTRDTQNLRGYAEFAWIRRICVSNRTKVRHFTPWTDRQIRQIEKLVKTLHVKITDFYVST